MFRYVVCKRRAAHPVVLPIVEREPVDGRGFAALYSTIAAVTVIVYPMVPEFDGVFVRRISS